MENMLDNNGSHNPGTSMMTGDSARAHRAVAANRFIDHNLSEALSRY